MGHRRAQMLRRKTRLAPAPEGATRGLTVDVLAACIFVFSRKVVAAPNDGRSEAQRPESRLAPESTFAGPA